MHYKYTDIKAIVAEILENKKDDGGVKNIYFVGCGGSLGALYPAKTFMERESLTLKSGWVSSNEFVHSTPRDFGKNSIICLACHKGNTPETIAAAKLGKEMGAAVIILTWLEESEIIEFGDYIIHYSFDASPDHLAGDIDYAGEKTMCALQVAVELLNQTEGYSNYDKFQQGAGMIVTKGTDAQIEASVEFLKWFTQPENNIAFSVSSGYLPVTHAAASLDAIRSSGLELSDSITTVLGLSLNAVENDHLYTTHAFPEGSTARNKLQSAMEDAAEADRATVEEQIAAGQTPEEAEAEFLTDDYFDQWYETTRTTLEAFAG